MALLVKELFSTLQGEGIHAGKAAVFVRLAGCNLWSGREEDRVADANRRRARCPIFCDTNFLGGQRLEVDELARQIAARATTSSGDPIRLVVFTGGEPLVQLNRHPELLEVVRFRYPGWCQIALETNGSVRPHPNFVPSLTTESGGFDWICVSPKVPLDELNMTKGNELKVVFPAYDPLAYRELEFRFDHLLVSPEFPPARGSLVRKDVLERAVQFCLEHPAWRLSLQQHKYLEVP